MIQGKETVGSLSEFDSYSLCVVILYDSSLALQQFILQFLLHCVDY